MNWTQIHTTSPIFASWLFFNLTHRSDRITEECPESNGYFAVQTLWDSPSRCNWESFDGVMIFVNGESDYGSGEVPSLSYKSTCLQMGVDRKHPRCHHIDVPYAVFEYVDHWKLAHYRSFPVNASMHVAYTQSNCVGFRDKFALELSLLVDVRAYGNCPKVNNHLQGISSSHRGSKGHWKTNVALLQKHGPMFSISMEHSDVHNYSTEKFLVAWFGQTVPIYFGDKGVFRFFNPGAMVLVDSSNLKSATLQVEKIMNNGSIYSSIYEAPLLSSPSIMEMVRARILTAVMISSTNKKNRRGAKITLAELDGLAPPHAVIFEKFEGGRVALSRMRPHERKRSRASFSNDRIIDKAGSVS